MTVLLVYRRNNVEHSMEGVELLIEQSLLNANGHHTLIIVWAKTLFHNYHMYQYINNSTKITNTER